MAAKTKIFYRESFKDLYIKSKTSKLSIEENALYNKILYINELGDVIEWQSQALEKSEVIRKKWLNWGMNSNPGENGMGNYFSKAEEDEDFKDIEGEQGLYQYAKPWRVLLIVNCSLIQLKLATYASDQSQLVRLMNCELQFSKDDHKSIITVRLQDIDVIYKDPTSELTILRIKKKNIEPGIQMMVILYSEIKMPNEIKYKSQEINLQFNIKSISHFINFMSFKGLGARHKKEVRDGLKDMQEKALIQITNIFYYEKTYKLNLKIPKTNIEIPAEKGNFSITLHNIHIADDKQSDQNQYSTMHMGLEIEILYNKIALIPLASINFAIYTLAKKFLKVKWECKETAYDNMFDLKIVGSISEIVLDLHFSALNDVLYLQKALKIHKTLEAIQIDRVSVLKNPDMKNPVLCVSNGKSQKTLAVLKNDVLFLFYNDFGSVADDYFLLSGAIVEYIGGKICLKFESKELVLEFYKKIHAQKWYKALSMKIEKISFRKKFFEKKTFRLDFMIEHMFVNVISANDVKEYRVKIEKQEFLVDANHFVQDFAIKCTKIKVKDSENKYFFECGTRNYEEKLVLRLIDSDSVEYKGFSIELEGLMSGFQVFCDQSTFKTLINSYRNLVSNEKKNEDKTGIISYKTQIKYQIKNFNIIFLKDTSVYGKFSFETLDGEILYINNIMDLQGNLKNAELMWIENTTRLLMPILSCKSDKNLSHTIKITEKSLDLNIYIYSLTVLCTPEVFYKICRFFSFLMSDDPTRIPDFIKTYAVFFIDLKILIKKEYVGKEVLELNASSLDYIVKGDLIEVIGKRIIGKSTHLVLDNDNFLLRMYLERPDNDGMSYINVNKLGISTINLYLDSDDMNFIIGYTFLAMDAIKKNWPVESSRKVEIDSCFDITCTLLSMIFMKKQEGVAVFMLDPRVGMLKNDGGRDIEGFVNSVIVKYDKGVVAEIKNCKENSENVEISSFMKYSGGKKLMSLSLISIKVLYSLECLLFCIDYYKSLQFQPQDPDKNSHLAILPTDKPLAPTPIDFSLHLSLPEIIILIIYDDKNTTIKTSIQFISKTNPKFSKFSLSNFEIQTESSTKLQISELNIISSQDICHKIILDPIIFSLTLNDFIFYSELLSEKTPKFSQSTSFSYPFFDLDFSSIVVNLYTEKYEPLLEVRIFYDERCDKECVGNEFSMHFLLDVNFHNWLLNKVEPVVEEVIFGVSYSVQNMAIFRIFSVENEPINVNVTDYMVKHFMSICSNPMSTSAFSVYNNTGYPIVVASSDGYSKEICDQHIEEYEPPTENTILKCTVLISENYKPTLSKVPLFSQEPQCHELDKITEILVEVRVVDNARQLKVSSPYEFKNMTELELNVAFFCDSNTLEPDTLKFLEPFCVISVPLLCYKGNLVIIPPKAHIEKCQKISIDQIKSNPIMLKSSCFYFLLDYSDYTIYIRPTLILTNYLPSYIHVITHTKKQDSRIIFPSEKAELFVPNDKPVTLTLTINGFDAYHMTVPFVKALDQTITISNRAFSAEIGCYNVKDKTFSIVFYPLLLIVNMSPLPLEFLVQGKNGMILVSEVFFENKVFCGAVDYLFAKVYGRMSLSVDLKNTFNGFIQIDNTQKSAYQLVYHITTAKVPEEDIYMKVITVDSRIYINNCMDEEIQVVQAGSPETSAASIKPNEKIMFNWTSLQKNQCMSIRVRAFSLSWTGTFEIRTATTLNLKIPNDPSKRALQVEVKHLNDVINVCVHILSEMDLNKPDPHPSASLNIFIDLPIILISIIQQEMYKKSEVLLLGLKTTSLSLEKTAFSWTWVLTIKDIQLDSQIYDFVVCPIILISDGPEAFLFSGSFVKCQKVVSLENIVLKPKNLIVNVDSNSLSSILQFFSRLSSNTSLELDFYLNLQNPQIPFTTSHAFLSKVHIYAFSINFTYKLLPGSIQDRLKSYLMDFQNILICFQSCKYSNIYGSISSFAILISEYYKKSILDNIAEILKQHGIIGGALAFLLQISDKISKMNSQKCPKLYKNMDFFKPATQSSDRYNKLMEECRNKSSILKIKLYCYSAQEMLIGNNQTKGKMDTVIDVIMNPFSCIMNYVEKSGKDMKYDESVDKRSIQRVTRVFYGRLGIMREFKYDDCLAARFFVEWKRKYALYSFYGQVTGTDAGNNSRVMIVVFDKAISMISLSTGKVLWKLFPLCLEPLSQQSGSLEFTGQNKKGKKYSYKLRLVEQQALSELSDIIANMFNDISR